MSTLHFEYLAHMMAMAPGSSIATGQKVDGLSEVEYWTEY